jgi:hypothetical protein
LRSLLLLGRAAGPTLDRCDGTVLDENDMAMPDGRWRVDWPYYPKPGERHPAEQPYVVLADPEGNRFCVAG